MSAICARGMRRAIRARCDPASNREEVLMTSPEDMVREFSNAMDRGDAGRATEFFAEDAINHGFRVGREGVAAVLASLIQAFPDSRGEIVDLIAVDDVVACRITMTGTHQGTPDLPFVLGGLLADVPPTGKRIEVASQHWFRVHDGEIVEHWAVRDDLTMGRQLGLVPPSPTRPTP
jgi:steroid delta-isomerase-like uncharacterized protein